MKQSANNVTKAIERVLTFEHRAFVWRQNNTGVYRPKLGKWTGGKCLKGVPDIIGCLPGGKFIGVEVKVGRDEMSEHQKLFKADLESKGGIYIEARSLDDFMEKFKQSDK